MKNQIDAKKLRAGMQVVFKNLLEETCEDICRGTVTKDGSIACLCGCGGQFETEDVEILDYSK